MAASDQPSVDDLLDLLERLRGTFDVIRRVTTTPMERNQAAIAGEAWIDEALAKFPDRPTRV